MAGLEELSREELIALVERLLESNAKLTERVKQLERQVSRDSANSSMPPSTDDLPGRATPAAKPAKRADRKRGKQKGAPGSAMSWAVPDTTVPHRPSGNCGCGADLAFAEDLGVERSHQVHDLPEVRLTVWQHDVHRVRCACGTEHLGSLPDEVPDSPLSYGPNLRSLVVYLLVYQHVPVQRCVQLIADLTGGKGPSGGFVHGMLTRCARAVNEVEAVIRSLITMAHVAGFDETTLRVGPAGSRRRYVLSASTETATVYHLGGRDLDSFADAGILPGFAGIAVHDRYSNYFHSRWENLAGHQACVAHLLRDFADAAETYPDEHWPKQAQRALRGLIKAWHQAREKRLAEIDPRVSGPLITEFDNAVKVGISRVPRVPGPPSSTAQRPGRELLEFCRDRQGDVLRFSGDTRVWPTNNISERNLRPTKTQQKISGRLTSEDITQDRLNIRSYIDTARKQGVNVMTALRQAITGNPWQPALPPPI
ncbi:IS66 family transposase [Saccharopolyspora spinosa]|uniref:Transposase IS66 family protein n=1 Tax=Saccharopolyspora spinosa TaxID=60894 RepID=A0A2N3XXS1_SACSN|nr:IS66 family transposase [Saccharopolyspora spinosa]PKW15475.1 transposase IS66 family protein [Saccharopolyspora spinosa]